MSGPSVEASRQSSSSLSTRPPCPGHLWFGGVLVIALDAHPTSKTLTQQGQQGQDTAIQIPNVDELPGKAVACTVYLIHEEATLVKIAS
ncbi:hypothetical protein K466DRAFT_603014 [Polyporus arcularius HHB13444]|uniref:Uncharacterized protein n=1 Tax=Polyporus arcularius HHB13444 TaxID=1314778 RepID=A0A5C3P0U7_9APHY|nr:hypothetical protein K466DRAFT_603014 [Polyporus arcularius HHB13444]